MMATAPVMFAGVAGCFAAGTELAILSGGGGRTLLEGSGTKIAGRAIFVSSCGGGGRPLTVCGRAFSLGRLFTPPAWRECAFHWAASACLSTDMLIFAFQPTITNILCLRGDRRLYRLGLWISFLRARTSGARNPTHRRGNYTLP